MLFKEDRCYRPDEVAKKLDVKVRTIYRYIEDGKLKAVKLGEGQTAPVRIEGEELNRFMGEREKDPMGVK